MDSPTDQRVSVVIPCHSQRRWPQLVAAVESVLAQRPRPLELVVVVDRNQELFDQVKRRWADVTVLANNLHAGASGNRNTGIRHTPAGHAHHRPAVRCTGSGCAVCRDWHRKHDLAGLGNDAADMVSGRIAVDRREHVAYGDRLHHRAQCVVSEHGPASGRVRCGWRVPARLWQGRQSITSGGH